MKDEVDEDSAFMRELDKRRGNRLEPIAPAFAAMAGDEQARESAVANRWRR
jgi:hypothetical protein